MIYNYRYMPMENHVPLARDKEMGPFTDENPFHKVLRNTGFYLTTRNPAVQLELTSRSMDYLRPNKQIQLEKTIAKPWR